MLDNINFSSGKIIYFDFDVNPNLPLNNDSNIGLKEDMLLVEYPHKILLDVGWFNGIKKFVVCIVRKSDWYKPIARKKCKDLESLEKTLSLFINKIRIMIDEEDKKPQFKSMVVENLDFSPGKVLYNDFVYINPNLLLAKQIALLKEKMLWVVYYHEKYLIDVGWHPTSDHTGQFEIKIFKDFDWSKLIYSKETKDIKKLCEYVKECIEIIKSFGPESD